ncbi:anthranilate synthase component II [Spirosoma montaniterrae]|uniref:Para-aminobenzoate synthase n=1 Tax=Spirosoma montaniterrae TaxID=1178516 RepID=A0A1P9WXP3_9BACT|nr:aminodeoxychorismate/anthranilate synthase component II [Spirosoma montaniterrae]AQG80166.1 para-aminobenzoate synthase [Spirosoma montaniterrae]
MELLVIDNFDSFTYMLVDYLQQAGATCHVIRNNEWPAKLPHHRPDAVVLSPGPGIPRRAGQLMQVIDGYYQHVPMLGVCLGHQALGEFFGATLTPAERPMHGKVSPVRVLTDDVLTQTLPDCFNVTRYHSLLLTNLPGTLLPLLSTDAGEVMAFRHRWLPIWGVQFHPEAALTEYGTVLLKNWIDFVSLPNTYSATTLISQHV